jgi:hypothetical protein
MAVDLLSGKQGAENVAAAFTGHLAVLIRLKLTSSSMHRGRGRCRMNTTLLKGEPFRMKIRGIVHFWVQYVKQNVKRLFINEGVERNADRRRMEDLYYFAIYDVLREPGPHGDKVFKLKRLKAKIVRLSKQYRQRLAVDTAEQDQIAGFHPSLYHLLQSRKWQENRLNRQIVNNNDETRQRPQQFCEPLQRICNKLFNPQIQSTKASYN